jgi:hypothetical protein
VTFAWFEAEELLRRATFKAFALRLRAVATLLLAMERRSIAHLRLDKPFSSQDYSRDFLAAIEGAITKRTPPLYEGHRPR